MNSKIIALFFVGIGLNSMAQQAPPVLPCERPDLIVSQLSWNEAQKRLTVRIMNRGGRTATAFLVYAQAETTVNTAQNPLCQSTAEIASLAAGASLTQSFTFPANSCPAPKTLTGANRFRARVDAKDDVCECVESNNSRTVARPGF